jgi:hypothetical protein
MPGPKPWPTSTAPPPDASAAVCPHSFSTTHQREASWVRLRAGASSVVGPAYEWGWLRQRVIGLVRRRAEPRAVTRSAAQSSAVPKSRARHRNLLPCQHLRVVIADLDQCLASARSIATIALVPGTSPGGRASRAFRLRPPRDTPLPMATNVLFLPRDTKPAAPAAACDGRELRLRSVLRAVVCPPIARRASRPAPDASRVGSPAPARPGGCPDPARPATGAVGPRGLGLAGAGSARRSNRPLPQDGCPGTPPGRLVAAARSTSTAPARHRRLRPRPPARAAQR